MDLKEFIYTNLKLVGENDWKFFIGKTNLGHEIFMIIDSSQEIPFFLWDKKSGIRMDKGDYLIHSMGEYNLKEEDVKDVTDFLNSKSKYGITNFKYMLIVWNYFNKNKVDENLKVPDYKELPEYSPTYKDFWKKICYKK